MPRQSISKSCHKFYKPAYLHESPHASAREESQSRLTTQQENQLQSIDDSKVELERELAPTEQILVENGDAQNEYPENSSERGQEENGENQTIDQNENADGKKSSRRNVKKFPTKKQNSQNQSLVPFKFGNSEGPQKEEIFQKKMQSCRDFNFWVNFGSNLFVQNQQQPACYKIYVGRGNNRSLIKKFFRQRWWWTILDASQKDEANFMWTQLKNNDYMELFQANQTRFQVVAADESFDEDPDAERNNRLGETCHSNGGSKQQSPNKSFKRNTD